MAGYSVPVDDKGSFAAEEILPEGMHTVEVAVLDEFGSGELFLRDLELKKSDWFTVGIGDLTLSGNKTNGPAKLLSPDKPHYSEDISLQGRLAFYTNGKFDNGWSLTASADTREGPLDEIFSNFMDKSPEALFRRIDPDYHYPTFGDDSTVAEDAPTTGKFYVKVKKKKPTVSGATLRSHISTTTWPMWTADFTAPICTMRPRKPPLSGSLACWWTDLPLIRVRWPAATNCSGPKDRSISCAGRMCWKDPKACASRSATRIPGSSSRSGT